jgi:hypothetical protein
MRRVDQVPLRFGDLTPVRSPLPSTKGFQPVGGTSRNNPDANSVQPDHTCGWERFGSCFRVFDEPCCPLHVRSRSCGESSTATSRQRHRLVTTFWVLVFASPILFMISSSKLALFTLVQGVLSLARFGSFRETENRGSAFPIEAKFFFKD